MKVAALVPIKMNNERVPGKNTKSFSDGTPLIHMILRALIGANTVDEIYVYCSNENIKKYIIPGVKFLKRDEKYDSAQADVNDMFYSFSKDVPADIYVLAHATAPFLTSKSIDNAVNAVKSKKYDSAIAVRKMQEFIWKKDKPINYDTKSIPRTQDLEPLYVETTGMYVFTKNVIQNIRSRIGKNPYLQEVSLVEATDINNPIDFEIADAIYNNIILNGNSLIKQFKKKINSNRFLYGPFMKTADPMFVEAIGHAGFDFVILDMEHGPVSFESQQNNIRAAVLTGMIPIIRVPNTDENTIGTALDIGAFGVQVPQVKNAEQARQVVSSARFYPKGMRGVCRFVRAAEYSHMERNKYFETSNDMLIIIQLEGKEAIANLDEILDIEGIDILFVGPYDLSQALGVTGEVDNPIVIKKMKEIISRAKSKGKVIGTFVDNMEMLKLWRDVGVQYLSYSVDIGIFTEACENLANKINGNNFEQNTEFLPGGGNLS